ncbi:MAG: polyisoprenoid-binding protein [Alphaproteobacteria bacterium]|nr:MAG: polyisoprenoid-binding protein [Alphaproteobacteria bacterium]
MMTKLLMTGLLVAAGLTSAVHAADAKPAAEKTAPYAGPTRDYKSISAGTYELDKTHAGVTWRIDHLGFSNFIGRFEDLEGTATVNPADLSKSGVVFTIKTDSVDTNVDKLDDHIEKADILDTDKYPTITFTSTKVEVTGKNAAGKDTGKIYGMLSLKGVTKPVVMDVVFNGHGVSPFGGNARIGFDGSFTIKRSDFGVNALLPMVGDNVEVTFAVEFTKK